MMDSQSRAAEALKKVKCIRSLAAAHQGSRMYGIIKHIKKAIYWKIGNKYPSQVQLLQEVCLSGATNHYS
jgi:hypothetical protein